MPSDVLLPASPDEARSCFGEAPDVLVVGGGTIVVPELRSGQRRTTRVMLLNRAQLSYCRRDGDRVRIGATTTIAELAAAPDPLGAAAREVADAEIRAQATIAGNVCAGPGREAPRGDLQAPLIAMDAHVHWTDGGPVVTEPIERFLAHPTVGRLVLEVDAGVPSRGAYVALRRPHSHGYTSLAVCCVELDGHLRWAASGVGPHALALRSATDPVPIGEGWEAPDDAVASSWYRTEMLAVLTRRCLAQVDR